MSDDDFLVDVNRCFVCGRRAGKGFFSLGNGLYICRFCSGGEDVEPRI